MIAPATMKPATRPGKLDGDDFDWLIGQRTGATRAEVRTGPAPGVDVSVISLPGGMALALTSDPLSLVPSLGLRESAWLSVHLMANDMATTGFAPMYAQMVLNLLLNISAKDLDEYWSWVDHYCREIGVSITGGHTGLTEAHQSPIAGAGTMLLTAPEHEIILSKNVQPGDLLIMTGEPAISSSAILSLSFPSTVRNAVGNENWQKSCEMFWQTSVLQHALVANQQQIPTPVHLSSPGMPPNDIIKEGLHAMHDVTEGGVLGAAREMAIASAAGLTIFAEAFDTETVPGKVCAVFGLDPLHCIGAGSMLMSATPNHAQLIISSLHRAGIAARVIGEFSKNTGQLRIRNKSIETELPYFSRDPYWEAYFLAVQKELL